MRGIINRTGFSLIEVNMAILIAAGGLLSLFSLFPGGLRHSVMSQEDLYQATFASSLLDAVSANAKQIEDVKKWNDSATFWKYAVGKVDEQQDEVGKRCVKLDLPATYKTAKQAEDDNDNLSDATDDLVAGGGADVWFVYQEQESVNKNPPPATVLPQPQYLIRLSKSGGGEDKFPARYTVSVVSTHLPAPANYHRNAVYSMDYYFCGRP